MKKLALLLVVPFILSISSCGMGKEIQAREAKEIINLIKEEAKKNPECLSYTKILTSKSEIIDDGIKSEVEIYDEIKRENSTFYTCYEYTKQSVTSTNTSYYYESDGKYYENGTEIERTKYEDLVRVYNGFTLYTYYLDLVEIYVSSAINGIKVGELTCYSNGDGNLTIVYVLQSNSKDETYYSKTTYQYDNYRFVYYEFESEAKEDDNESEKQFRTESVKYKASIRNPFK